MFPLRKLKHPALVPIDDVVTADSYLMVKQPKIGVTLRQIIADEGFSETRVELLFQ